jgi:hypothetical protein
MDLKSVLSKVAPWLAAAASGPAGLATMAATTVAKALGADGGTPDDLPAAVLSATPEQVAALRQAEQEFQIRMRSLGYSTLHELESLAAADRANARDAAVKGGTLPWVTGFAMTLVLAALACEMTVLMLGYPTGVADVMAGRILGFVDGLGMMAAAFLFGTTVSSGVKTALIAQAEPIK